MTAPRLGQGMPVNDGWLARQLADIQRQINELRVARSLNAATVDPTAPIVTYIAGSAVPLGTPPGAVVEQTASGASMKVWQAATDSDVLFACGVAGDAYPRIVFYADPVSEAVWFGDGTFDPTSGSSISIDGDGAFVFDAKANGGFKVGSTASPFFGNVGTPGCLSVGPLAINSNTGATIVVNAYAGDPNGNVGGNLNDPCFRTDLSSGAWLYRCTAAGDASTAVWTQVI